MEILVICNPAAGRGRSEASVRAFVRMLERKGHQVEIFLSQAPGGAFTRASQIDHSVERLVIAGGDGTVNEVLNGLSDPARVPILHFPTGTANMLSRDLGLPRKAERLATILEQGAVRRVDMGLADAHRFLLLASAGFDAMVTREIKENVGKAAGYLGYARPILRTITRYRPADLKVSIDEQEPVTGTNVLVLNVRHYGGYFVFSDGARLDSGHFDVCLFRSESALAPLRYMVAGFIRMVPRLSDVKYLRGTRVTIESSQPCPVQVDGDYFGCTPVTIQLVPAQIPLVVPRDDPNARQWG